MKKIGVALSFLIFGMLISGCSEKPGSQAPATSEEAARWYSPEQVAQGELLYRKHCVDCHLPEAQGTKDWRTPLADGGYPPPPLNGSAHAWHHPLPALLHPHGGWSALWRQNAAIWGGIRERGKAGGCGILSAILAG